MKTFFVVFCLFCLAYCSYNCGKDSQHPYSYSYEVKEPVVYKFTPTKK